MVKQKNHTARNRSVKDHANGIKLLFKRERHSKRDGICPRFLRNSRYAAKASLKALKKQAWAKRRAAAGK